MTVFRTVVVAEAPEANITLLWIAPVTTIINTEKALRALNIRHTAFPLEFGFLSNHTCEIYEKTIKLWVSGCWQGITHLFYGNLGINKAEGHKRN